MAINIKFDLAGNPEPPTIILAKRNGNKLGQLQVEAESIELNDKLNDASEFSFTLYKYTDGKITNLWSEVVDFKLVYCKEWDMWFEIVVELDEETETVKTVTCTQLGQAELSQIMLYDIHINEEGDSNWNKDKKEYKSTILYSTDDTSISLLHRLLKDKAPHYSIKHVDGSIKKIQRTFSFDGTSIYDAFMEIAEEIGCLFIFHSNSDENGNIQRTISVYDLQQNCMNPDCVHRGEFTDTCPKCGGTNIRYGYGEDTTIFVTADELAASGIQLTTDTDAVKNCFKLEAGDDLMTATVVNCNPNGTPYIWYFSDAVKADMSKELVDRIESYDDVYKQYYNEQVYDISEWIDSYNDLVDKYAPIYNELSSRCLVCNHKGDFETTCPNCGSTNIYVENRLTTISQPKGYSSLMNVYYNVIDMKYVLESSLMPKISISTEETSAEKQAVLLTSSLSTIAVPDLKVVSVQTANSTVLSMAKLFVKPTYKVEIVDDSSELSENKKTWKGKFTITNYSEESDTYTTGVVSVAVNDDEETYVKQKIDKVLNIDSEDYSIAGLFDNDLDEFTAELWKYALNPLTSFHDACQSCIDILIDQGAGDKTKNKDLYEKLYLPYYKKLLALEEEIKIKEEKIAFLKGWYDSDGNLKEIGFQGYIEKLKNEVKDELDFETYLGKDLWLEFCTYRREDKYSNDNYISDGLDNVALFKKASEFIKVAQDEIYKSAELQHSISTSLKNLLAIPKFKPLVEYFSVGNWFRVRIDDEIYKLRLLEYNINFGGFDEISVDFSDVTKIKNGITDVQEILSQASSMATSYSSTQKQASQGEEVKGTVDQWLSAGLNSAQVRIQSNNTEDIVLDKNGLLCRSYDNLTDVYSPEQLKITHNIMAYTDDNWLTVRQAIGKHDYVTYNTGTDTWSPTTGYGMSAEFVTAGQVMGSKIVGGEIYSNKYSSGKSGTPFGTYINLETGDFEIGGKKFVFDASDNKLILSGVEIDWDNPSTTKPTINNITGLGEYIEQLENFEEQLDGRTQTWYQDSDPSTEWTTDESKDVHVGDLWHYTGETVNVNGVKRTKNSEWIWKKVNNDYAWVSIEISDAVFDAIDGKAQIFTSTPTPPYNKGDLWVQGSTGDILHCNYENGRTNEESFVESDWGKSSKYTDDAAAKDAKGVADKAKQLGESLANVLGYDGTKITGTYIYSPVISGGSLLMGDSNNIYAEITLDGKLICTGADIKGKSKIGGWSVDGTKIYAEKEINNITYYTGLKTTDEVAFYAGSTNPSSALTAQAKITHEGNVYFGYDAENDAYNFKVNASSGNVVMRGGKLKIYGSTEDTTIILSDRIELINKDENTTTSFGINDKYIGRSMSLDNGCLSFYSKANYSGMSGNIIFQNNYFEIDKPLAVYYGGLQDAYNFNTIVNVSGADSDLGGGGVFYFGCKSNDDAQPITYLRGSKVRIYAHESGAVYLGSSGSTAITSDENLKDIYEIDERYEKFFMNIKPVLYRYKNNGHRYHVGYGARQVESALLEAGISNEEFAGLLIDRNVVIDKDEARTDSDLYYDEIYSLRYEEFGGLNTLMLQKAYEKINNQQQEIDELKKIIKTMGLI